MREALKAIWHVVTDDVTGSVFWWPHGLEYKRSLTRCSQGQGAWAWQVLKQWIGLEVDAGRRQLTLAPRGLLTGVTWKGFRAGPSRFDIIWHEPEGTGETVATVTNYTAEPWTVKVGFRQLGSGATGTLSWQTQIVEPGASVSLRKSISDWAPESAVPDWGEAAMARKALGSERDAALAPIPARERHGRCVARGDGHADVPRGLACPGATAAPLDASDRAPQRGHGHSEQGGRTKSDRGALLGPVAQRFVA